MLARIRLWLLNRIHEAELLNRPMYEEFREQTKEQRERMKLLRAKRYLKERYGQ